VCLYKVCFVLSLLPSPPLSQRRRCCDARRLCVCVCVSAEPRLHAALVSVAKVMRCIQCCLVAELRVFALLFLSFAENEGITVVIRSTYIGPDHRSRTGCYNVATVRYRWKFPGLISVRALRNFHMSWAATDVSDWLLQLAPALYKHRSRRSVIHQLLSVSAYSSRLLWQIK